MAERLVLHIGTQKSGTTYLQRVLAGFSGDLADQGVLYPLDYKDPLPSAKVSTLRARLGIRSRMRSLTHLPQHVFRHRGHHQDSLRSTANSRRLPINHEAAFYGLLGESAITWVSTRQAAAQAARWTALQNQIQAWDGTVILSAEALSVINEPSVAQVIESLGVSEINVIITARDLGRVLPSSWQQHVRNGRSISLDGYIRRRAEEREETSNHAPAVRWNDDPSQGFWRAYAIGSLAERWEPYVTSVSVVTVPKTFSSRNELWSRFRHAMGLKADLAETAPVMAETEAHVGLRAAETVVLSALNATMTREQARGPQARSLREEIIQGAFVPRPNRGVPPRVPQDRLPTIQRWAREDMQALKATEATLVGQETDLLVDDAMSSLDSEPSSEEVARAAAAVIAYLTGARVAEGTGSAC